MVRTCGALHPQPLTRYPERVLDSLKVDALERAKGLSASPSTIEKVAKATSVEAAQWAFTQWALRKQAASKFALADRMLFTREALEQATHERLAHYHASRFPKGVTVADLSAGIGADLIALSARGPAVGFELDEERAEYARHNLKVHSLEAELRVEDSLQAPWDFDYAFADPARRVGGQRTLDPADFQPNPLALANKVSRLKGAAIKLSPMLQDRFFTELGGQVEFLSFGRECREALVLFPGNGPNAAVHLESRARLKSSSTPPSVDEPRAYLYEADPAAIRADCLGTLTRDLDLKALGDSNGYLTGERLMLESGWLTPYRVLASHKADVSLTKKTLESLRSATPVIKSRAGIDVQSLAKSLKLTGPTPLILAVYPTGRSLRHVVLESI